MRISSLFLPSMSKVALLSTFVVAVSLCDAAVSLLQRTPFGVVHKDCVLQLPHLSTVAEVAEGVLITYANGSRLALPPCPHSPRASYEDYVLSRSLDSNGVTSTRVGSAAQPAIWEGWPWHFWFGARYSSTTKLVQRRRY